MEIVYRQQLCLAFLEPFGLGQSLAFRTMTIAAGVISNPFKSTPVASLHVPFEPCEHTLAYADECPETAIQQAALSSSKRVVR